MSSERRSVGRPASFRKSVLWYLSAYYKARNRGPTLYEAAEGLGLTRTPANLWNQLQRLIRQDLVVKMPSDKTYVAAWEFKQEEVDKYAVKDATFPDNCKYALTEEERTAIYFSPEGVTNEELALKYNSSIRAIARIRRSSKGLYCGISDCVLCFNTVYARGLCWSCYKRYRREAKLHLSKDVRHLDARAWVEKQLDMSLPEYVKYIMWLAQSNVRGEYLTKLQVEDWDVEKKGGPKQNGRYQRNGKENQPGRNS